MANPELIVRGGRWNRDYVSRRHEDDPANRPVPRIIEPGYKQRCSETLIQGLRLLSRFDKGSSQPTRIDGPLFLATPDFEWREPIDGEYTRLRTTARIALRGKLYAANGGDVLEALDEERFGDLDLHPDKTSVTLETTSIGSLKGRDLMTVTDAAIVRIDDTTGDRLFGGTEEFNFLSGVMNSMQQAAFPKDR